MGSAWIGPPYSGPSVSSCLPGWSSWSVWLTGWVSYAIPSPDNPGRHVNRYRDRSDFGMAIRGAAAAGKTRRLLYRVPRSGDLGRQPGQPELGAILPGLPSIPGEGLLMCWFNRHWWRLHPEEWSVRVCRICRVREQAMYQSDTGLYWVRL